MGQIPGSSLALRPAQLQQKRSVGLLAAQGVNNSQTDLLFCLRQLGQEKVIGLGSCSPGHDLHPAGHSPTAGRVKARLQQRKDPGSLPAQNVSIQIRQFSIAVPQASHQSGNDPVVGKIFRMIGKRLFDQVISPAAGTGQCLQQRPQLTIGHLLTGPHAMGQRLQFPSHARRRLGVDHRVHQGQHIQQSAAPLFRGSGQQGLQPGADLRKHRTGSSQRGQPLPGTLKTKVFV